MKFDRHYQIKLLNLILAGRIDVYLDNLMREEFFDDQECGRIFKEAKKFKGTYGLYPNILHIKKDIIQPLETRGERKIWEDLFSGIEKSVDEADEKFIKEKLLVWAKCQAIKDAVRESVDIMRGKDSDLSFGDFEDIKNNFYKAFNVGNFTQANYDYFSDVVERLKNRNEISFNNTRTLITELDQFFYGKGVAPGELAVICGHPGKGKTVFLVHVAKAGIIQKKKVWFITLEMPYKQIALRLDAVFTGIEIDNLIEKQAFFKKAIDKFSSLYSGNLVISSFPIGHFNVRNMEENLRVLETTGFKPDMVVIDSADLMSSPNYSKERFSNFYETYMEQGNIYLDLKSFGQLHNCVIWTAAWAGRQKEKELLTLDDIAESYRKAMIADIILTINQNSQEYGEGKIRLFIAKNRMGKTNIIIVVFTDFKKAVFYRKLIGKQGG